MAGLGAPELLLVVGAIVLLFGAKKLPEFARSLGTAKQEFKRGLNQEQQAEEMRTEGKHATEREETS